MQNIHRIGATLETLPAELKLTVAAHFDPDVPHDLRWSQLAQHDAQIRRATLASLSLVSRSWAGVLESLRWKTLHVGMRSTHSLLELARDCMPRYGAKVKTVVLLWWTSHDVRILTALSGVPKVQQALDTAECLTVRKSESASPSQRAFALHDALIATIIRACPNLVTLKFRHATTTSYLTADDHAQDIPVPWNGADCALRQFGSMISSADLSRAYTCVSAKEYLNMMPNLEHLRLRVSTMPYASDLRNLFLQLSQLPRLVSLELDNLASEALEYLRALPCRYLTHLVLSGVRDSALAYLVDALEAHRIASLCLRGLSISNTQFQFFNPILAVKDLSIDVHTNPALLDLFDAAPLNHVEFCAPGGGRDSDRITPQQIELFIIKHRASLLSIKVDGGVLDAAELSAINRSLEQQGVSVRVVMVD